jgi:DNA-binding response OmpR family regulator
MIVLVVDDLRMQLDMVGSRLSRAGYKVLLCHSGEEAIETLNSQMVDLVITDMDMKSISGEDILNFVRQEFGAMPVILMTGNPDNLKKRGFDGYLEKPFSMQNLLDTVENTLTRITSFG